MTFHNYLKGGPYDGFIFTYRREGGKQELLVTLAEYFGDEEVIVSVYALEEVDELQAWMPGVYQTSYVYVGERTVAPSLVNIWQDGYDYEIRV